MKRYILLFPIMAIAVSLHAQLRVDSLGNVKVDKSLTSTGTVSISDCSYIGLQVSSMPSSRHQTHGSYFISRHKSGKNMYNIYCTMLDSALNSSSPGKAIGIYSNLTNGSSSTTNYTAGVRYGICGVNGFNGAAIYGSSNLT